MSTVPRPDLGAFIRQQRARHRLSLRRLAELAGVSNPYLSQIERGLRRPSAEILQQLARALQVSAETLYVHAGFLDGERERPDVVEAILADERLQDEQKATLVRVYELFVRQAAEARGAATRVPEVGTDQGARATEPEGADR
ncbi:helix-turn-helix domain-containing protein [Aciditerrimonas ferrireducens]|uniref:Helix-turn-helix domain-containing protein n=1 Tax=Aciditerrimonas ferrireducens TaxID=667306 RepID=A0ABV6C2J7_9ACTN